MSLFVKLAELESSSVDAALCTVVSVSGSAPRKAGAKMIVVDNQESLGKIFGTIGGGAIEHLIRGEAIGSIRQNKPRLITTSLRNQLGMCCGGEMTVFIEPIVKKPKLICFGAGHISEALCPIAFSLGYEVHVADERKDLLAKESFNIAKSRFDNVSSFSLADMPFSHETYLVIATHDHDLDQKIAESILSYPFKYAALVGSKRKALMTKKRLLAKGFGPDDIEKIICPAGIEIHAVTPEEIALSIAAQMIMVKNGEPQLLCADRSGGPEHAHGLS